MKGSDIADALSVNPLAEFAVRPGLHDVKVVRVRGLAKSSPGTWTYTAATDPLRDVWYDVLSTGDKRTPTVRTRDLCTVEDADRQVAARIEANAQQFADNTKLDRVVATLTKHGIDARRFAGGVHVRDAAALGRLLARLP